MSSMKEHATCIVAISNEDSYRHFYENWKNELTDVANLLIVENNATHTFDPKEKNVTQLSWHDIDTDLGKNYWIIPRNSSALISYGCYKAVKAGAKHLIILDEKSEPVEEGFFKQHLQYLSQEEEEDSWHDILANIKPKGVPFYNRQRKSPVMLNHGMWTENAILDAAVQLSITSETGEINVNEGIVPQGHYFSLSNINLSFNSEIAPLMYFLLMGTHNDFPFDGYGDIWCGIIAKKIMDHLNWGCRSGLPFVVNKQESNVWKTLKNDSNSLPVNESFWEKIDSIILTHDTAIGCYKQIADVIGKWGHPYFQKLGKAMKVWTGLFTGEVPLHQKDEEDEAKSASQLLSYIDNQEKVQEEKQKKETEELLDFLHRKANDSEIDPKEKSDPDAEIVVNVIEDEEPPEQNGRPFVAKPKKLKIKSPSASEGFIPRRK